MAGAGVEATRSVVGSRGVGVGVGRGEPRLLGSRIGGGDSGGELLPLAASRGGNPGALDVSGAVEPAALAAGPAPMVSAVLLGLVAAVLACDRG